MKIIGLSGSLRKGSVHSVLLEQAAAYLPGDVEFALASIDLPLYNEDIDNTVDAANITPASVLQFRQLISDADGLLIASPEYNHSISGPLKNALDWASRPGFNSPLKDKPVAIISASPSAVGGARGLAHLRVILASTLSHVLPTIEYSLGDVRQKIDPTNTVKDADALRRLERLVTQFTAFINRLSD